MKKVIILALLSLSALSLSAQTNKVDQLQALEQNQTSDQNTQATATLKSASRLFGTKDDLTTVIMVIPSGSVVSVLDSDSSYLHVVFEENEGYLFKRQAEINKTTVAVKKINSPEQTVEQRQPEVEQQQSRFSYLENKYGTNMAARLSSGKIWKGMNSDMVKDSWGVSEKVNRKVINNTIQEEWIYRNTWLYFENNTLIDWGPVRK
jgi:hypothetical protein